MPTPLRVSVVTCLSSTMATTKIFGERLAESVIPAVTRRQPVILDFTGVELTTPPFLNAFVLAILAVVDRSTLESLVILEHLPQTSRDFYRIVLDHSHWVQGRSTLVATNGTFTEDAHPTL